MAPTVSIEHIARATTAFGDTSQIGGDFIARKKPAKLYESIFNISARFSRFTHAAIVTFPSINENRYKDPI